MTFRSVMVTGKKMYSGMNHDNLRFVLFKDIVAVKLLSKKSKKSILNGSLSYVNFSYKLCRWKLINTSV